MILKNKILKSLLPLLLLPTLVLAAGKGYAPSTNQQAMPIAGVKSDGTIVPVLVDDDGVMQVSGVGGGSGTGDVVGPGSSTANSIALFGDTSGTSLLSSAVTISGGTMEMGAIGINSTDTIAAAEIHGDIFTVDQALTFTDDLDGSTVATDPAFFLDTDGSVQINNVTGDVIRASINDVSEFEIGSTLANFFDNDIQTTGVISSSGLDIATGDISADGLTLDASITLSGGAANRFLVTDGSKVVGFTGSSSDLANTVTNESGSGALLFGTNPTISGATISGGTINNTTIGATTPSTATFTNLNVKNTAGTADIITLDPTDPSLASGSKYTLQVYPNGNAQEITGSSNPISGIYNFASMNAGTQSAFFRGIISQLRLQGSVVTSGTGGNAPRVGHFAIIHDSTGTQAELDGWQNNIQILATGSSVTAGTVTNAYGQRNQITFGTGAGTGAVTNATLALFQSPANTSVSKTIGTFLGIDIQDLHTTGVTSSTAINIQNQTVGGNAITTGTGPVSFGDNVNIVCANTTTGFCLNSNDANALTTGAIARFVSNSADPTGRNLVFIRNQNAGANQTTPLTIQQDAVNQAMVINQNTNANGLVINTANSTGNNALRFASTGQTTGAIISVPNADSLTTGNALNFVSNSASASVRTLAFIRNQNTGATSATVLTLQQDADAPTLTITSSALTKGALNFATTSQTTANIFSLQAANSLTTGSAINVTSNSSSASVRSLVFFRNQNTGATSATVLQLQQDAATTALSIAQNGNGSALSVNAGGVTTGQVLNVIADALTSGSAFSLSSNSADSTVRNIANLSNNNASATGATVLSINQNSTSLGFSLSRGSVNSSNNLMTVNDSGTGSGSALNISKSGASYGNNNASLVISRNGNFTGVSGENTSEFRINPSFTMTEPAAGNFSYYGAVIDMNPLQVTSGAGGTTVAGLFVQGSSDADINSSYAILTQNGLLGFGGNVQFNTGNAMVNNQYMIGRDNDATNQLHFNTPAGSSFEFSVNDTAKVVLNNDVIQFSVGERVKLISTSVSIYNALSDDYLIHSTRSSTGTQTINLPAVASNSGRVLIVKDAAGNAGANNITLDGNGAETIDGAATYAINANYQSATLYCDGVSWFII